MNLQADIDWIRDELDKINDPELIGIIKQILEKITSQQYNKEIDEALGRAEKGEFYTHTEVQKILNEPEFFEI